MKERRAGAMMGAPRGCPGAPYLRLLRRLRGRTKAAAATGLLRGRTGHQRLLGPGAADLLPSVLRSCAFGAAPLLRAASVPLPAPGSVSALGGSTVLSGGTTFLSFGPCSRLCRAPAGTSASHLGVSLTPVPLASPLVLSQERLPRRSGDWDPDLRRGFLRSSLGPAGELVWRRGSALPNAGFRFPPR